MGPSVGPSVRPILAQLTPKDGVRFLVRWRLFNRFPIAATPQRKHIDWRRTLATLAFEIQPPVGKKLVLSVRSISKPKTWAVLHWNPAALFTLDALGLGVLGVKGVWKPRPPVDLFVTARYGLLRAGDAADINVVFNLVLRPRPDDEQWKARLAQLKKTMRFGTTLVLRNAPTAAGRPVYRLTPAPMKTETMGVATRFTFGAVKKLHGIPYVDLVAEVPTQGWSAIRAAAVPRPALTAATRAWPAQDAKVRARAQKLIAGHPSPSARLGALHAWVHRNIRHAGRQGSRDGTLAVLERGFGRCGDSADVMITLARAAGLPARLVAGWIVGGPGHFWAEVHVAKVGWVSVDATAPWIGVSGDYVPLMISEDGPLPLMHLRIPKIERIE